MIKNGKRVKVRREFSESLKLEVVKVFESGQRSVLELSREYDVNQQTVYNWIYKYSDFNKKRIVVVEKKDSQQELIKKLRAQIVDLKCIVGEKQINIDYLEKMIELAGNHFDTDIKKNFNTPHSGGSKTTKKK